MDLPCMECLVIEALHTYLLGQDPINNENWTQYPN
jgi:hypothetical protein